MKPIAVLVLACLLLASCAPKPEPAMDHATVVANNASVRLKGTSTSRTLQTLNTGDRVDVLERQNNWYRIRYGERLVGWMEESTIVTSATNDRLRDIVAQSQSLTVQNSGTLREDANFRIEPGRSTSIIRRLPGGVRMEILDRVTTPRPGAQTALDSWVKARVSPTEVGWVFSSLVDFDVPVEISQYTEGYTYTAVKKVSQVQDSLVGAVNWYVVGERSPGLGSQLDFDGIRVFTWNMKKHRYETAFRMRGLRGVYPLEVGQEGPNPSFKFYELSEDGSTRIPRDYVMYGVLVRPLKKDS